MNESTKRDFFRPIAISVASALIVAAILAFPLAKVVNLLGDKLSGHGQLPVGSIVAWNGNGDNNSLPDGWAICDGDKRKGTPDLRGLFLKGVGSVSDITDPNRQVILGNRVNVGNGGYDELTIPKEFVGKPINMPPYYTVVYIMKVR